MKNLTLERMIENDCKPNKSDIFFNIKFEIILMLLLPYMWMTQQVHCMSYMEKRKVMLSNHFYMKNFGGTNFIWE